MSHRLPWQQTINNFFWHHTGRSISNTWQIWLKLQNGKSRMQWPKMFSISCSFSEIWAKWHIGHPSSRRICAPFYRESWIRPWNAWANKDYLLNNETRLYRLNWKIYNLHQVMWKNVIHIIIPNVFLNLEHKAALRAAQKNRFSNCLGQPLINKYNT